jgi:hypothetical protein
MTYKDLPSTVVNEKGETILVHAFIFEAQMEARSDANKRTAEKILNNAFNLALDTGGFEVIRDWFELVRVQRGL